MDTKEILGYAAGSIGSAVLAVIILPLLSWYFPADDIGRIVLMQTAAGLTVSVLCLGLDQAYVREYYAAADKDTLFKTLFLPPLLSAAAIAALLLSRPSLPSEILFSLDDAAAGIGLVLFELSFLPIRFLLLVLRMEGRALAFSSAQLVSKLAILLLLPLTVGLLHFPANTAVLTAVYALANLAAAAFLLFQNRCRLKAVRRAPFSSAVLHRGLRYGIPIALSSIAYWGLASADRLFLKKYAGLEQLGVYSMGISFGGAALLFQSIFSTVWTPYIFRAIEANTPPLGNGRICLRPACRRRLPDRHFLAPRLPPAAGKLRRRPVYRRIVYAAAAVLHAGRNQRHRFERRPKNTPDRARHLGRAGGKPAAAGACRTVRRRARRGGCLCRLILVVFCFQDRKLLSPVAAAQTPAALYAHIALPDLLGGLHLLRHTGKLPPVCRRMGGISGRLHPAPLERFAQTVSLFEKTRVSIMKIILTTSMSGLGGTETATVRLGRLLKRRGHDIILASSDGPFVGEAQASGIRWQPVDFYRGGLAGYLKSTFAYARMLRREQPDIIDCQMARVVPACALAAKIVSPKTKIIYHSHGLDAATYPKIAKLFDKLGVYIIGNCKHEREKLIRHGFPAGRIAYAYNALPPPPRNFISGKPKKNAPYSAHFPVWTPSAPCI